MYLDRLNCANPLKSTAINSATLQSTSLNSDALRANWSIFTQSTHISLLLPIWCSIYNEWKWLHAEQNYTREWDWSAKYSSLSRHHFKKQKKSCFSFELEFLLSIVQDSSSNYSNMLQFCSIIQVCHNSVISQVQTHVYTHEHTILKTKH